MNYCIIRLYNYIEWRWTIDCPKDDFKCFSSDYLPMVNVCDEDEQCTDGSDEGTVLCK